MSSVQKNPESEPPDMDINKEHAPRISGDGIGQTILHASFLSSFQAKLDNGANVPLNHFGQGRIVFGVLFYFRGVEVALRHKHVALKLEEASKPHRRRLLLLPLVSKPTVRASTKEPMIDQTTGNVSPPTLMV